MHAQKSLSLLTPWGFITQVRSMATKSFLGAQISYNFLKNGALKTLHAIGFWPRRVNSKSSSFSVIGVGRLYLIRLSGLVGLVLSWSF